MNTDALPDTAAYWWDIKGPREPRPRTPPGPCNCQTPKPWVKPNRILRHQYCRNCQGLITATQIEALGGFYDARGKLRIFNNPFKPKKN